ncbi:MAG: MFS transporter [Solirubrobacterales bacterium]|nr:MFS transporter [Solirubrobacterales bacterium]
MHRGRILATVTAAQVLSVASATVVAVALPSLARDLGADGAQQQWVVDAFVLVFASLLVAGGVLGDRYGRRTALLAGLAVFALGSAWCLVAPSVGWLLAGRVVMAFGPPLVLPASLAIVSTTFTDPGARARAVGIWGAGSGLGLTLGPLLGGAVVEVLGWRWVFGVNVPLCALLALAAVRNVPRDRPVAAEHPFDGLAAGLLTAAVALLVFGLIEGRELGWGSAPVLGAFAAAALLTAVFVRHERRHPAPLVDLALLGHRPFLAANLGGATFYGAVTGLAVYLSVFFQQVQGRSALEAGLCLLPQGACTALFAPVAGRLTARLGPRPPIVAGMAIGTVVILALLQLEPATPIGDVWWAFALLGAGIGIALPPMTVTAVSATSADRAGMASAIHNASRQLGQTFGVAVLGTIVLAGAGDAARHHPLTGAAADAWVEGLHAALLVAAGALAVAGVVVAVLVRGAGRPA